MIKPDAPLEPSSSEAAPKSQEPVSSLPEPEPAPKVPAEDPAEKKALIEEANRKLDEAYAEQAPVSEPAGAPDQLNPEAAPTPESTPAAPPDAEAQPSVEPTPEPKAPVPKSTTEQQPGTMPELETAATGRIDVIGEENLTDKEKAEIERVWDEGGPDRADKLNKIASRAEKRIAAWENTPKPEDASAKESVPEQQTEREETKAQNKSEKSAGKPEESEPQKTAEEYASLHSLQKEIEKLRKETEQLTAGNLRSEVERLREEKNMLQAEALSGELEKLLSEREQLTEEVTGKNITEIIAEAEKKVARVLGYSTREDYVKALAPVMENNVRATRERIFAEQEFAKLSKRQQKKYGNNPDFFKAQMIEKGKKMGLSQDEIFGLLSAGYNPQNIKKKGFLNIGRSLFNTLALPFNMLRFSRGNFFRSERKITLPNGKKAWMRTKNFKMIAEMEAKKYNAGIANEARGQLGEKWGSEVKMQTEEFMEKEANDLERAELKTREAYRQQRIKMFSEYLMGLSKGPRTTRGLKSFEAKVKQGRDLNSFYDQLKNRKGKLSPMNGDTRVNSEAMSDFLDDFGVSATPNRVARAFSGGRYERAMKDEGLLALVMDFIKNVVEVLKASPSPGPRKRPRKK